MIIIAKNYILRLVSKRKDKPQLSVTDGMVLMRDNCTVPKLNKTLL